MLGQHHSPIAAVAIISLLVLACSSSQKTSDVSPRPQQQPELPRKAPLKDFEVTFRPSDYDEDVAAVEKRTTEQPVRPDSGASRDSVRVEEEMTQGFRVQIFASRHIDEAAMAKQTASQMIVADSLYVVYDAPVYKVRVGDYATRLDANRSLAAIIQKGYPDAWVITDKIIKRKFIRVKREEN
jgi:hypothetical protein